MSKGRIDPEFIKWHHAIDTIYGLNHHKQDEVEGRRLMSLCKYPDAIWYTTWDGIAREGCVRSQCFDALGRREGVHDVCVRAARQKYVWAIGFILYTMNHNAPKDIVDLLVFGITNNDPRCVYFAYVHNIGCSLFPDPVAMRTKLLRYAAKLGIIEAYLGFARKLKTGSLRYCTWLEKAIRYGFGRFDFEVMLSVIKMPVSKNTLYIIGRIIHWSPINFVRQNEKLIDTTLSLYYKNLNNTKLAVTTWTLVALRLGIVRDCRRLVGEAIWKTREEALY
jgi:hypothetical protein